MKNTVKLLIATVALTTMMTNKAKAEFPADHPLFKMAEITLMPSQFTALTIFSSTFASMILTDDNWQYRELLIAAKEDAAEFLINDGTQASAVLADAMFVVEQNVDISEYNEQEKALLVFMIAEEIANN